MITIKDITIKRFPVIIITDVHCSIQRVNELKKLYPELDIICLGDITNLFKVKDEFNKLSINCFIENKIPCLEGNHESFIKACYTGNSFILSNVLIGNNPIPEYNLDEKIHIEFLKTFPIGFKLILPDGNNCFCFHNAPLDLWGFNEKGVIGDELFKRVYPIDDKTKFVIHGHLHKNFIENHPSCSRVSVGPLKENDYAFLTENQIVFKRL